MYLGYDAALERKVALKVMLPQYAANADARERFLREARSAAKVRSDHVVTIFDVGEEQGAPFIAMEYLLGHPLDQFLKQQGELPLAQVLRVGREAALGLAAAHALGLVHRDIKPGNLWLEAPQGRVKLLDFGLARPADDDAHLTNSGAVVGTPAYMSPEQGRGLKVDLRSDLFSLGVMLYRLATGKMPFTGSTTMAVLTSLAVDTPAAPRQLRPDLPAALEAVITRLLAKDPAERFQTAAEVADALQAVATGPLPVVVALPAQPFAVGAQTQNVWDGIDVSESVPVPLATRAEPGAEPTPALKPRARPERKASKWLLILTGVGLLAACAVLAVVQWPKKKESVAVNTDGGKPAPTPGVKQPPVVVAGDPDRKAAEYVISVGGAVSVNGEAKVINAAADLPTARFALTGVNLHDRAKVTDAGLAVFKSCKSLDTVTLNSTPVNDAGVAHFKDCTTLKMFDLSATAVTGAGLSTLKDFKNLTHLGLQATRVDDAGLAHIKDCKKLIEINLAYTAVGDNGVAHLKDCKNLTILRLSNTQVGDAGLAYLKGCASVAVLDMSKTKVTPEKVAEFAKALPRCQIAWDGGLIVPTAVADPDRTAAEWALSVGGGVRVSGRDDDIKTKSELPKEQFSLVHVSFSYRDGVNDASLEHFRDCGSLSYLALSGAQVGDAGLERFKTFKCYPTLTILGLWETQITDKGLAHLAGCKSLRLLNVKKTKVTAAAVAEFAKALPQCKIEWDGGTVEPKTK